MLQPNYEHCCGQCLKLRVLEASTDTKYATQFILFFRHWRRTNFVYDEHFCQNWNLSQTFYKNFYQCRPTCNYQTTSDMVWKKYHINFHYIMYTCFFLFQKLSKISKIISKIIDCPEKHTNERNIVKCVWILPTFQSCSDSKPE